MQENSENNNFELTRNTWRRLSGEVFDSPLSESMSGNSSDRQSQKEKEEIKLLAPEPPKVVSVAVNTGITAAAIDVPSDSSSSVNFDEKLKLIQKDNEDNKETANESNDNDGQNDEDEKNDKDFLEAKDTSGTLLGLNNDCEKQGDNVDSVYLRAPPPHKIRTTNSTNEEEDCGVKCLYYVLQCCDCVLM